MIETPFIQGEPLCFYTLYLKAFSRGAVKLRGIEPGPSPMDLGNRR